MQTVDFHRGLPKKESGDRWGSASPFRGRYRVFSKVLAEENSTISNIFDRHVQLFQADARDLCDEFSIESGSVYPMQIKWSLNDQSKRIADAIHLFDLNSAKKIPALLPAARSRVITKSRADIIQHSIQDSSERTVASKPRALIENGFSPSRALSELVREVSANESDRDLLNITPTDESLLEVKSKHLKTVIYAMFQTIADSHQIKEHSKQIVLSSNSRFHDVIAAAILFRVNVSIYDYPNFLSKLHRELLSSVRIGKVNSNNWKLVANYNEIALEVSTSTVQERRPFRIRAKSYKPRMAYGANE
jgi:hypothetical protein